MGDPAEEVLIVGASARGLAESAGLAGFRVHAVDGYGDLDLLAHTTTAVALRRDLGRDWSAATAVTAAAAIRCGTVAYVSNLENHPRAVARLASGRDLWGNAPEVLQRVRDPFRLAQALRERGFSVPQLSAAAPSAADAPQSWLLKPRRSGGGQGIRLWRPGERVPRTRYLQEWVDGVPGSIAFVADGRRALPLGLSLQLVGKESFGISGFRYCGSLLCGGPALFAREAALTKSAAALAEAVTEAFGLVGVNGLDFVARDGIAWPVEVNPRYSASMELVERAHRLSIFGLHAEACGGHLRSETPFGRPLERVYGKAIVYARDPVIVERVREGDDPFVRDVPHRGERISRGQPICTVFAEGDDPSGCLEALEARAGAVYCSVTKAERSVA